MDLFTKDDLKVLLLKSRPPCVSFYLPTRRGGGDADPIRWRNLLARAEEGLARRGLRPARARELLGPARYLLDDPAFWKTTSDGLAYSLCRASSGPTGCRPRSRSRRSSATASTSRRCCRS
jgi:hypothetical protein